MKKQEIKEIRAKKKNAQMMPEWSIRPLTKNSETVYVYREYDDQLMLMAVKDTKRGYTFESYIAGQIVKIFISRADCEIVYNLGEITE